MPKAIKGAYILDCQIQGSTTKFVSINKGKKRHFTTQHNTTSQGKQISFFINAHERRISDQVIAGVIDYT
jgi:hypothetical protein